MSEGDDLYADALQDEVKRLRALLDEAEADRDSANAKASALFDCLAEAERERDAIARCRRGGAPTRRMARDAARYRWMRSHIGSEAWWAIKYCDTPEMVDAAVDSAMLATYSATRKRT